jgi:hypothetical protein
MAASVAPRLRSFKAAACEKSPLDSLRRIGQAAHRGATMAARIYQRYRNGMQASRALRGEWVLEFESKTPRRPDPLTGWSGGADTQDQVQLVFPTAEAAKAYAEREGLDVHLVPASARKLRIQSYAENFR